MFKQFLLDLKVHKDDFALPLFIVPVCFALGFIMLNVIMFTVDDPGTWFTMGTFMAFICLIFFAVLIFSKYYQQFMLALSMGRTRKSFMVSYALRTLLWLAAGYLLMLVLYRVELAVGSVLFAAWPLEEDPTFLMDWKFIAVLLPCVVVLSMFVGALYSTFGKKALVPLWFLWMAVCLLGPQLLEVEEGDTSAMGMVAAGLNHVIQAVPDWGWITLGVAALAGMAGTVIVLGKKQMVR